LKEAPQHSATNTHQHKPFFNASGHEHFFGGKQGESESGSFFQRTGAQPKLEVGASNDSFERQADHTADQVVRKLAQPKEQSQHSVASITAGSTKAAPKIIQCRFESDDIQQVSPKIQKKGAGADVATAAPASVESGVAASKGKGTPMAAQTRDNMESAFGQDFSAVRIHSNSEAAAMNQSVGAQAFAHGNDIYFNEGKYAPETSSGAHLLAHELTHTVQQGGGAVKRNVIQRAGGTKPMMNTMTDDVLLKDALKSGGYKGFVKRNGSSIEVHMEKFVSKKYLAKMDTTWIGTEPIKLPKSKKKRDTRQIELWKGAVKDGVKTLLKDLSKSAETDNADLSLNLKSRKSGIIGKLGQLADEVAVPFWTCDGAPKNYDVEHMVDYQICGSKADNIENLILLNRSINRSIGNEVKNNLLTHFSAISEHYRKKYQGFGSDPEATMARFNIYIDSFEFKNGFLADEDWYYQEEMVTKTAKGNPYKKANIEVVDAKIPKDKFLLRASASRPGYLLPLKADALLMGGWYITADYDTHQEKLTSLMFDVAVKDSRGVIGTGDRQVGTKGRKLKPMAVDFEETGTRAYKIDDTKLRKKFGPVFKELYGEVRMLSPIELGEISTDGLDIKAGGKVLSTLSIFKGTDITFSIENGEFIIQAEISAAGLGDNFPKPFKVSDANLIISASSVSGLSVLGNVMFNIGQFGSGELEASVDKGGVGFAGKFNFNSKWFNPAEVKVAYKNGEWSMGGKIGIPAGLVPGVEGATLTVGYDKGTFSAAGEATLSVPGVDKVMLSATFDASGNFTFTAEVELANLPGVKSGSLAVTIGSKEGGGIKLSAAGHAVPDFPGVPGLSGDLSVSYDDGLFDMRTKIIYKKGRFEGEVALGATNMAVDDQGQPLGGADPSGAVSVFGYGQLTVTLFGENKGTVKVRFTPDKELMVAGEASINNISPFGEGYGFEKELLPFPRLTIPLVGIPGMSVSAFIDGGVFFKFNWEPLVLKQLKVAFNETNINDLSKAKIDITGSIGSKADAEVYMAINAGLKAQVLIASLTGSLGGEAGLGISAEAGGDVKAEFDLEKGLRFKEINAHLDVTPRAIFKLTGTVSIDLDLWITTVNLYYHKWILAEKALDLGGLSLSLDFPIRFDDDNKVIPPEYNTMDLKKPDFTGDSGKGVLDKAINGDAEKELAAKKEEIRSTIRYDLRHATDDEDFTPSKYKKEMVKKYGKSPELKEFVLNTIKEESRILEYEKFGIFKDKIRTSKIPLKAKLNLVDVSAIWLFGGIDDGDIYSFRMELIKADEDRKAKEMAGSAGSPVALPSGQKV
jgi:hypothetical protein